MYGKTILSWNVPAIHNGNPEEFTRALVDAGFEGVCLKAADGIRVQTTSPSGPWPNWGENIKQELVDALKAAGLKVYFWHFLYGFDSQGEASVAISQCSRFQPDGYAWDAEGRFESHEDADSKARTVTRALAQAFPDIKQTLLWWAFPKSPTTGAEWHPVKIAHAFLEVVETIAPMMYWQGMGASAATSYLSKSTNVWRTITQKPLIPVGRAYTGDGGTADASGISAFGSAVKNQAEVLNYLGTSWWVMDKAFPNPSWKAALVATPKWNLPVTLPTKEILRRLVGAHPELFPELEG